MPSHLFVRSHKKAATVFTASLVLMILCAVFLNTLTANAVAQEQDLEAQGNQKLPTVEFVPGEVLVRFRKAAAKDKTFAFTVQASGREIMASFETFRGAEMIEGLRLARVPAADTLLAIEGLRQRADVEFAEPNYIRRKSVVPNDPLFNRQWSLRNAGHMIGGRPYADTDAESAWNITTGSRDTVVGVIDEDVWFSHEDLREQIWRNPAEIPGNNIDDDQNGFIDDAHGFDFYYNNAGIYGGGSARPREGEHGTHVAGIIGARGDNGVGVSGVNWRVSLLPLKVLSENGTSSTTLVAAYAYAKQMRELWLGSNGTRGANIRVLNNSYGGAGKSQAEYLAIRELAETDILFVAAAGNENVNLDLVPIYPAAYDLPNIISVAAFTMGEGMPGWTNWGTRRVHLYAPGTTIISTSLGLSRTNFPGYSTLSGTSMAAPHVAGAAALLLAVRPNLTAVQMRAALLHNGVDISFALAGDPAVNLLKHIATDRRLNLFNSLRAVLEDDHTPPAPASSAQIIAQRRNELTLAWTATGDDGTEGISSQYDVRFSDQQIVTDEQFARALILSDSSYGATRPLAAGTWQTLSVRVPFGRTNGFVAVRVLDHVGNQSQIVNVAFNAPDNAAPYTVTESAAEPLSTGGERPPFMRADEGFGLNYQMPFEFPYYGALRTTIAPSPNGALFFLNQPGLPFRPPTAPPAPGYAFESSYDFFATEEMLTAYEMIAPLWDDLTSATCQQPRQCGFFVVKPDENRVIFRWESMTFNRAVTSATDLRGENPVSFETELRRDGTIIFRYGDGNERVMPVVGISGGAPSPYVIESHTSAPELSRTINLTRARTITFTPQFAVPTASADIAVRARSVWMSNEVNEAHLAPRSQRGARPGKLVNLALFIENKGPSIPSNVTLTATLPSEVSFVSCAVFNNATCGATRDANGAEVVNFNLGKIGDTIYSAPAGTGLVVRVNNDVTPGQTISITTHVASPLPDPVEWNNSATQQFVVAPRADEALTGIASIHDAESGTFALRTDGSLWAWGHSFARNYDPFITPGVEPTKIEALGNDVVGVSATVYHALVVKRDGTLWLMGYMSPEDPNGPFSRVPVRLLQMTRLTDVKTALAAELRNAVVLQNDGTVWEMQIWRDENDISFQNIYREYMVTLTRVNGLTNVRQIYAKNYSRFAVKRDGTVWAWGNNGGGQLGLGHTNNQATPALVPNITNPRDISVGAGFTLLIGVDGVLHASGTNGEGQLGDGTTFGRASFAPVGNLSDVVSASGGTTHSLAVRSDGSAWFWGKGANGVNTSDAAQLTPQRIETLSNVATVSAGSSPLLAGASNAAVLRDGTARMWGANVSYQLGDGTNVHRATPVVVGRMPVAHAPRFDLPSGEYVSARNVRITSETAGATIRYTTDGREPTASDTLIVSGESVLVERTQTLKAKAFFSGWHASATETAHYVITRPLLLPATAAVQFSDTIFRAAEAERQAVVVLTRTGDLTQTTTVEVATIDDQRILRCDDRSSAPGIAFARCDYATTIEQITFAPRESQKTLTIPLVDDTHSEGSEQVEVVLRRPSNATLGASRAVITIFDNDAASGAANPVDLPGNFVRQQYLDFLSREPEANGLAAWMQVLANCSDSLQDAACDRTTVSSSFFRSDEFQAKGLFVYLYYKATLGRLPRYHEMVTDMRRITGATGEEVSAKKNIFAQEFARRAEFLERYPDTVTNDQFVSKLLEGAGLGAVVSDADRTRLIATLNDGTSTRGAVVREIVGQPQVSAREFNGAFVAMQYFGYLRRDPEPQGYADWLRVLERNPQDYRTMVSGFVNSTEYRLRFGAP